MQGPVELVPGSRRRPGPGVCKAGLRVGAQLDLVEEALQPRAAQARGPLAQQRHCQLHALREVKSAELLAPHLVEVVAPPVNLQVAVVALGAVRARVPQEKDARAGAEVRVADAPGVGGGRAAARDLPCGLRLCARKAGFDRGPTEGVLRRRCDALGLRHCRGRQARRVLELCAALLASQALGALGLSGTQVFGRAVHLLAAMRGGHLWELPCLVPTA
mmetsp:Transcript_17105/g.53949  ORF Transcript_17105/g.53949 Transcript_17105/m.53949 type:complete len:218 (+) Transcript_17105:194-847(+)